MRQLLFTITTTHYNTSSDVLHAVIAHKGEDHDLEFDIAVDFSCDHMSISSKKPGEAITINPHETALVLSAFVKNFCDFYQSMSHDCSPLDAFELFTEFTVDL